jgi:hypothetical protein
MTVAIRKSAMNFFVGPNMVREGLVVHLDPRNPKSYPGSGATVFDISREGAVCNAVFSGTYSISNEGIYFDGISGNCFFPQPSVTYTATGILQEWTAGFFIKSDNDAGWLLTPSSAGADQTISLETAGGGRIRFQVAQGTDVNNRILTSVNGSVPVTLDKWTYVVCTLKGLEMKVYINGLLNVTRTNDTPIANWAGSWRIAARAIFTGQFFRGTMDNIHVYKRELLPEEIKRNFNAFKGRYPNLCKRD